MAETEKQNQEGAPNGGGGGADGGGGASGAGSAGSGSTGPQPPEERSARLQQKLDSLPPSPGVYIMKDADGHIIYVGKAVNLRNRVRSYFTAGDDGRLLYPSLVERIRDLDYVVTNTEKEALILENNFIKQFKPKYNLRLTDDKSYILLAINMTEPYPRVQLPSGKQRAEMSKVQKEGVKKNGMIYFGPYTSSRAARETIRLLNRVFPLRKCKDIEIRRGRRPCLHHQMGKMCGYCSGMDEASYRKMLDQVIMVLNGKYGEVLETLTEQMAQEAKEQRFERAAQVRDRIRAIQRTFEKQVITSVSSPDRDIFGHFVAPGVIEIVAMFVRDGKLGDLATFNFELQQFSPEEVFASFLKQFYSQQRFIPKEVLIPVETEDADPLAAYLSDLKGEKVEVLTPRRGEKTDLVELARRNAENSFRARVSAKESDVRLLELLQQKLELRSLPERIECFDISNIQGRLAVGAMVTFDRAMPNKNRYRRYKIRTVTQSDDFAMMREVLLRHLSKAKEETQLPSLIMVDGGKGQLSQATAVMEQLRITSVDVIGIAKTRLKPRPGLGPWLGATEKIKVGERIFVPGRLEPIVLPESSPELHLLQRVRDEAHRFAIRYHRELRKKKLIVDPLAGIPGVGPAKRKALLDHFGDVGKIRDASIDHLCKVKGISENLARAIRDHLHHQETPTPDNATETDTNHTAAIADEDTATGKTHT
ncbi:MAG TPA: excinuclease ABC subunit UvrC [Planctomycetota bacterium]|nr:excinuclease ABC subunit UvrC [Planctomycetota bacterium]